MKLLQKGCVVLQQNTICYTIECLGNSRGITGRTTVLNQGSSLWKKCYTILCKDRTSAKEKCSIYSHLQRQTQDLSKLFSFHHTHANKSLVLKKKVNCKITWLKEWNGILNVTSYHKQCLRHCSSSLLTRGKSFVWHHVAQRGMKSGPDQAGLKDDEILNPLDKLQKFVSVPLLPCEKHIFKPSKKEVVQAQKMYVQSPNNNIQFLKSALFEDQLPDYDLPEVAFIGRSNVGKSSLISMLLNQTDVFVRISKSPGHTKLLNFFQVGKKFTLVDMPGYGYNMPHHYADSVESFLNSRKNLKMTFLLYDGHGPNTVDAARLEMINSMNFDYCIVLTKIDKNKPSTLLKSFMSVLQYRDKTQHCFPQPFLVSSVTGEGIPLLKAFIAYVTGNLKVKGL